MNQADLVVAAAERARLTKAVEALVGTITEALKQGEEVRIAGFGTFGTFGISERGERQGGNPQTGSPIRIAASKAVRFTAGKTRFSFARLPWVQRIALNLIRRRPSGKDSLTVKRKKAGWSIAYLIETIAAVPA
jgi:DNA-binding protein HU-beta